MSAIKNISINKKSGGFFKFLFGAIALLFFIAVINFFSSGIKSAFYFISSPIEKTFWSAGESTSGYLKSFYKAGSLAKENEDLKIENQRLLSQVTDLQAVIMSNSAQNNISLVAQNNSFKLLLVGVIGLDKQDELTINKGSDDGVSEGMPVINQEKALFGKVSKVYKKFSEVMLISNKNSVINVKIYQQDETKPEIDGVVKGKGGLALYLDLVPIDDTISKGDILLTSALEGTFPKNLLVGKITKVDKNDQNPHQQAQVKPFFNVSTDNLFVITDYKK